MVALLAPCPLCAIPRLVPERCRLCQPPVCSPFVRRRHPMPATVVALLTAYRGRAPPHEPHD